MKLKQRCSSFTRLCSRDVLPLPRDYDIAETELNTQIFRHIYEKVVNTQGYPWP